MNAIREAKLLLEAQQFVATALAEQFNIRVIRGGKMAMTDGKVIHLPSATVPRDIDDLAALDRLVTYERGYVDHEVGHCRYTKFAELKHCKTPLTASLLNAIEDPRIENAMAAEFKACDRNLRALSEIMVADQLDRPVTAGIEPGLALTGYVCHYLRLTVRKEPCYATHVAEGEATLRGMYSDAVVDKLHRVLATASALSSTKDARRLAEAIVKLVQKAVTSHQQQQQQQQAASASGAPTSGCSNGPPASADPSSGQGDVQADSGDRASDSGKPKRGRGKKRTQATPTAGAAGDAEGAADGNADASSKAPVAGLSDAQANLLAQALATKDPAALAQDRSEQLAEFLGGLVEEMVASGAFDVVSDTEPYVPGSSEDLGASAIEPDCFDLGAVRSVSAQLRNRLVTVLETDTRERTWRHDRGTRVDARALATYRTEARVFLHTQERTHVDTAVFVLCDVSGSMSGPPITLAREAMLASAMALELIPGVDLSVGVFPGRKILLRFGQRLASVSRNFGVTCGGGTPLTSGLDMAWRHLRANAKPRKLCVVLTDGQPDDEQGARAMINAMTWSGIELVGVGIRCRHVERHFPEHCVVNSLAELPPQLMSVLHGKLMQRVRRPAA
jgi:hypothetical protein